MIIGAGPVGVTAALLLARQGVRSLVLERHRDVYPLPRAVVVDDEVRRILQSVGIHEEFAAVARPARGLRLLDARHRVIAEFARSRDGHHGFPQTSMFDQPELERLLRAALVRRPECELWEGVEVVSVAQGADVSHGPTGPVHVTFRRDGSDEDEHLWADAVLGCDGAGGLTRDAIGAVWEDLHFEESWRVIDVRTSRPVRTWEVSSVSASTSWREKTPSGLSDSIAPGFRPTLVDPYREHPRRRRAWEPAVPVTQSATSTRAVPKATAPSPRHVTPAASCSPTPRICARRKRPWWRRSPRPARR